jgi:hypothetical protein
LNGSSVRLAQYRRWAVTRALRILVALRRDLLMFAKLFFGAANILAAKPAGSAAAVG